MNDQKTCPRCLVVTNGTFNRLITEECGHVKCRNCLLQDVNGCSECAKEKLSENDPNHVSIERTFKKEVYTLEDTEENSIPDSTQPLLLDTQELRKEFIDRKQKFELLQQLIIPPSNIAEAFTQGEKKKKGKKERQLRSFPVHILELKENNDKFFKCTYCQKKFRSRNQRYYHIYCNRKESKPFQCKLCSKSFATSSHLNYHAKTHSGLKLHKCDVCPKVFTRDVCLQKHMKKHETYHKYTCEECNKKFTDKFSYNAHMNRHKNILPFVCDICNKKFSYKSNLKQHKLIHSDTRKFKCNHCGKTFTRKSTYKEHELRHSKHRDFVCLLCSKTFIDRKTLERHCKTHDGKQCFGCPFCAIKSIRKDNLIRHIRNMHSTENIEEALQNIKICLEETEDTISSTCTQFLDIEMKRNLKEITEIEEDGSNKIVISSSVIRSIGNVVPVKVPNDCDLDVNMKSIASTSKSMSEAATDTVPPVSNTQTTIKPRKKYDPCEIYRKILLDTNDDDDLTLENSELSSDSKDAHIDCCNEPLSSAPPVGRVETHSPSHFTEMHWRKRTSQYFFSAM